MLKCEHGESLRSVVKEVGEAQLELRGVALECFEFLRREEVTGLSTAYSNGENRVDGGRLSKIQAKVLLTSDMDRVKEIERISLRPEGGAGVDVCRRCTADNVNAIR